MRILIAEDDLPSLALLASLLKKHGHEVVQTTNGTAAWDALQQPDAPSLAILDWMMPGIDGPEVVRRVHALPTARPPYFIMLSARAKKADIIAGLAAGANDYLAKPFDFGELLARVEVGRRVIELQADLAAMNEKLAAERARYFDLYDRAPSGYITVSEPGLILEANLTAATLLGVARPALVNQPVSRVIHQEDLDSYHHLLQQGAETGEPKSCELRIVKSDGTPLWVHLAVTVAQDDDGAPVTRVVLSDIAMRKRAEKELQKLQQRLSLSEQDERRRIAASLHDCTVQDLVASQLNLNRALEMLGDEHRAVREILGDCAALAENNASELRSLAYDLHAPWLQYGGLLSGIQEYTRQFSIRTGISVSFEPPPAIPRLQPMKEMALYRVMQESLMNVHRHSGAKRAWIVVSLLDNELRMTIRDEGGGGTPASNRIGVGILSMHERMSAIGGRLDVCRKPEGVSTLAILPLVEEKYYGDS